ncbi:HIT family protein [Sphingomonas jatrophae]|uniref:Diadenosine tetraphosphate (Ap4A) hydrolase n=1 Tax=Sphingomonas jatrophae TaxID=1166337 RepID=A0A1I6K0M1_9SPHN|nr:HIT family protein [Sphingomonas jatrophae]SFR84360.1 Diadenosine tetraphosphate (Ap4A) hydrolase [Sphingomonas jatrophae]
MNPTIEKFGWPATLVAETAHWLVLLRPAQPTLGSLVLAAKSDATAFADLPPAAFADLGEAVPRLEAMLCAAVAYDKLNYLMLMMVDPNVHYHVLPRYEGQRAAHGLTLTDAGWPGQPALGDATTLTPDQIVTLRDWLKGHWPA